MKYLLILSCLLFTSISWSKDVDWYDLVERDRLYYEKYTDIPFTGNVVGAIQVKIIKGKREGEWLRYRESGQLHFKSNYKDGKLEGEFLTYYENGQLSNKSNYKDGKLEGEERFTYYENGQLEAKGNFKDGKREGESLFYNENGQLALTYIWKNGEIIERIKH